MNKKEIDALQAELRRLQDRVNYLEAITPLPKPKSTGSEPYTWDSNSRARLYEPLKFARKGVNND